MESARGDTVELTASTLLDESLDMLPKPLGLRTTHIYNVSGCSFHVVNGRYFPVGTQTGAIRYENVRGWALFRLHLTEIPELGIYAEACYDLNTGPSFSAVQDARAVIAQKTLLIPVLESGVKEGTAKFKRNYIEVTRAGNRMKVADQTEAKFHSSYNGVERQTGERAYAVSKRKTYILQEAELAAEVTKRIESRELALKRLQLASHAVFRAYIESDDIPKQPVSNNNNPPSPPDATAAERRGHHEQKGVMIDTSASFHVHGSSLVLEPNDDDDSSAVNDAKGQQRPMVAGGDSISDSFTIESVESFVNLQPDSTTTKPPIKSSKFVTIAVPDNPYDHMDTLHEAIRELRVRTIECAEAVGAWARLCHREAKKREKFANRSVGQLAASSELSSIQKTYCVIIAAKGKPLYPFSRAVKSTAKRFRRDVEPEKLSIEMRHIGVFVSREDAELAFSRALASLGPHEEIPSPLGSKGINMFVGMRNCGRHYIVRSHGVQADLPCEQCKSKEYDRPKGALPAITKGRFTSNHIVTILLTHTRAYLVTYTLTHTRTYPDTYPRSYSHMYPQMPFLSSYGAGSATWKKCGLIWLFWTKICL